MKPSLQISFQQSKSGHSICTVNSVRIHSSYDPVKEADRFIQKNKRSSLFILMFPCGEYLKAAVQKHNPSAKILSIHFTHPSYFNCKETSFDWHPEKGSIRNFIFENIKEWELNELVFLRWKQGAEAVPVITKEIETQILDGIKALQASAGTSSYFYYKWLQNSFINASRNITDITIDKPVLLAASGPGLERSIKKIKRFADFLYIAALPSSFAFLKHHDIRIDVLFSSDPGYWAARHFDTVPQRIPVIAPLTAAIDDRPLFPISQNNYIEQYFFQDNCIQIPSQGTVTATAIRFFSRFQKIFVSGVDLQSTDMKSHSTPHNFDAFISELSYRCKPELLIRYQRLGADKIIRKEKYFLSPSLQHYQTYFKQASFNNTYTIDNNNDLFEFTEFNENDLHQQTKLYKLKAPPMTSKEKVYANLKNAILMNTKEALWAFAPKDMLRSKIPNTKKMLQLLDKVYELS